MKSKADVVIVGAGVIGCSTAYHLACLGITDVAVVEMAQIGSGSSGQSASMLSLQYCHDPLSVRMTRYSYDRYMRFEEELDVPIDFKRTGWLSLGTEAMAASVRRDAEMRQANGIETEILSPAEIARRYPEINVADIAVGAWGPDDGPFDPHMIMTGYSKRAREMGVAFYQGVRATGITAEGGRVTGVVTDGGTIATRTVINAAGPWAVEVGRWVGVEIPQVNTARTIVVTGPFPAIPSDNPFVYDLDASWYYRPEGPSILMGMGDQPVDDPNVPFQQEMVGRIIDVAVHRAPVLENASFQTGWTGVRPTTPDDLPILGPVPSVEGFLLNCGWGGTGIIQAPIAGQLLAEYVAGGQASTMALEPLDIGRFAGPV
jgi:glycine/D-amino acid oxidase-like deaminating enzyme